MLRLYRLEGLLLRSVPCGEGNRLLTFFSLEEGKKQALAYGVEKTHSKKRGSVQPYSRAVLQLRRGRELDTVVQAEPVCMYPALHGSLDGLTAAAYVAELVDAFSMPEEPFPRLFRLIDTTWQGMGRGYDRVLLRAFEMRLLTVIGYRPHLQTCLECGSDLRQDTAFFVSAQGGLLCRDCTEQAGLSGVRLGPPEHLALLQLLYLPSGRLPEISWPEPVARKVKHILRDFMLYHLEKKLPAMQFLDWLDGMDLR